MGMRLGRFQRQSGRCEEGIVDFLSGIELLFLGRPARSNDHCTDWAIPAPVPPTPKDSVSTKEGEPIDGLEYKRQIPPLCVEWSPDFLEVLGRGLVPILTELPLTRSHRSVQVCSTRDCSDTSRTQSTEHSIPVGLHLTNLIARFP
jgi:hypothetical protein